MRSEYITERPQGYQPNLSDVWSRARSPAATKTVAPRWFPARLYLGTGLASQTCGRAPMSRFQPDRCLPGKATRRLPRLAIATITLIVVCYPFTAFAQDQPSLAAQVTKAVVFDPTTYAPATLAYT